MKSNKINLKGKKNPLPHNTITFLFQVLLKHQLSIFIDIPFSMFIGTLDFLARWMIDDITSAFLVFKILIKVLSKYE